jgi:hypothetical protein
MEALVVELNSEGTVKLPESIRRDLPPGTCFLVRRKDDNTIVLEALHGEPSVPYDLTDKAVKFVNELVAEQHQDYLVQVALTNTEQEPD